MFTRKYKWDASYKVILNGQVLKLSNEMKYLEVQFDSRMSWKRHRELKYRKFTIALSKLKGALGKNWRLRPSTIKWLFEVVHSPRLLYASAIQSVRR